MNTSKNSIKFSRYTKIYLAVVLAVFVISALICTGLFMNVFDFIDKVNSYILATRLADGLIRMCAAAALMTILIDLISHNCE